MKLPDLSAYQGAVQHPSTAFSDPELRAATVVSGRFGLPRAVAGNFAVTYHLYNGSRQWAVRCFHRDVSDRPRRYAAISQTLRGVRSRLLLDVTYIETGVRVGQACLPITKMPWLDGQPFNRAVEARLSAPAKLVDLQARFVDLVAELRALGIAHGDLQHGNILVDRASGLTLVDYDGMFVPALRGLPASESGDPNYQHPRRSTQFDMDLDRFAAIVIVTALRALAAAPSLWTTYNTDDNLLFRRSDFADPSRSPLFRDLRALPATRELAERLQHICGDDYARVPLLEDVIQPRLTRVAPMSILKPAHAAALNRLFGGALPPPTRRKRASGPRSWKLRRAIAQHAVAFSADGKLLASADADGRVSVREVASGRTRLTLHLPRLVGQISALAFDAKGNVIAAVVHGSSISIWDVTNGSWKRELVFTRGEVRATAMSASARHVVAATDSGTLRGWSLVNGGLSDVCPSLGSIKAVSISVSADGRRVLLLDKGCVVREWNPQSGRADVHWSVGAGASCVALTPDGSTLAVAHAGGRLTLWDVASRQARLSSSVAAAGMVGVAVTPDGQRVAIASTDGTIAVRVLKTMPTTLARARAPRSGKRQPVRLRPPDWLRDVLRRVATAVP